MKRHSSHLRRKKPKDVTGTYDAKLPVDSTQRKRVLKLVPAYKK
jgi:hypothetical protein